MPTALAHVLTIPPGVDLLSSLAEQLGSSTHPTWLHGNGTVEAVELRIAGEGADPTRLLRGRFTLVSLVGLAGGVVTVTLARATDAGLELLGGHLVRARSAGVTIAVFSHEPTAANVVAASAQAPARRDVSLPPSSRPASAVPAPTAAVAAPTAALPDATSWADVAASSDESSQAEEEVDEEEEPTTGDVVDHFSFGLCDVIGTNADRLRVRDIKGAGRIREISLDALGVARAGHVNGKRLFRLLRKVLAEPQPRGVSSTRVEACIFARAVA